MSSKDYNNFWEVNDVSNEFGKYLRKLRKQKKMTARQLDKLSGISQAYISLIEVGKREKPSPDVLRKIAPHLGTTYEDLMRKAGYMDDENVSIVEITKQFTQTLEKHKMIELDKLHELLVMNDGKPIHPDVLKLASKYIEFLSQQNNQG